MIGEEIYFSYDVVLKIISYDLKKQTIYFEYNNVISKATTEHFLDFNDEKILSHFDKIIFKYDVNDVIESNCRKLLITDRFKYNRLKLYKVKCLICNYENIVDEYALKNHQYSCSCCYGNTVVEGVNDIPTTDPWMIPYFQGGEKEASLYTRGSNAKIFFRCPFCKRIHENAITISSLSSRKKLDCCCMDYISYPEKFMRNFLSYNFINYYYHVGKSLFSWCENYIYDFYIPKMNLIIETHGMQHYKKGFFTNDKKSLEMQKEIDRTKQYLAEKNGFNYMIIDCSKSNAEYIYEQLKNSGLIKMLNIVENQIDLVKIEKECQKNIVYEVCKSYKDNITIKELSEEFKLHTTTISKYLKIGTKVGWCNYNPKLNLKLGQAKTCEIMTNRKRKIFGDVVVFDNNDNLIGKFKTQKDAIRKLKELGIDISEMSVCNALKKESHMSKNLYFYYENELREGLIKNESSS